MTQENKGNLLWINQPDNEEEPFLLWENLLGQDICREPAQNESIVDWASPDEESYGFLP